MARTTMTLNDVERTFPQYCTWPAISALASFLRVWGRCSVVISALASINVVNRHWARLVLGWVTWMGDRLRVGKGKPSRSETSYLGQLSLSSLRGREIEYRPVWLGLRRGVFTCVGWQVTPYGKWHSASVRWNTSINSYSLRLPLRSHVERTLSVNGWM